MHVSPEVFVDEVLRLVARHPHARGQAEVAHAIGDAEVEHLRDIPLLLRHLALGDAEAQRRGPSMDVDAFTERLRELGVAGHMREDAQLDLRVVRGHEREIGVARDERAPDAPAERRTDGDVL